MRSDFMNVLAQNHLSAPSPSKLIPHGSIIRLRDDSKGKPNTDGWCVGSIVEQGEIWVFGNWRLSEGGRQKWSSFDRTKLTIKERTSLDQTLQKLWNETEKEMSKEREKAAEKAKAVLQQASQRVGTTNMGFQIKDASSHICSVLMPLDLFLAGHSPDQIQMLGIWNILAFASRANY